MRKGKNERESEDQEEIARINSRLLHRKQEGKKIERNENARFINQTAAEYVPKLLHKRQLLKKILPILYHIFIRFARLMCKFLN